MDKQKVLFERLKDIKDYWTMTAVESLDSKSDLIWSDFSKEYGVLQERLHSSDEKVAYARVVDEIIKGAIHSILVMIDGGDELAETLKLDLVDEKNKKSLKTNCALHEEFYAYLLDEE